MAQPLRRTLSSVLKPILPKDNFWDEVCIRIKDGTVVPIISNSVHGDRIFAPLFEKIFNDNNSSLTGYQTEPSRKHMVDELVAEAWAEQIAYPLSDNFSLARVAQYNRIKSADEQQAKRDYLTFLKATLLATSERADPESAPLVRRLRQHLNESSFSDLAADLGLPDDVQPDADPLRLLARLNLPIYITTSYYDFLERAIRAEGREPLTRIYGNLSNLRPEHRQERDFEPTAQTPVVYHLHGLESYPSSLVLSEDDYIDFLMRITQPIDTQKPAIPLYLSAKLAESTLLLLGYRLQDWDFRATFRGLIAAKEAPRRPFSVAIQLAPWEQLDVNNKDEAERYLTEYFKSVNFRVEWSNSTQFVRTLWANWNRWRQGSA